MSATIRLVNCPNCDGEGEVPEIDWSGIAVATETCRIPECGGSGLVTIAERDAILESLDGLQHRSRP